MAKRMTRNVPDEVEIVGAESHPRHGVTREAEQFREQRGEGAGVGGGAEEHRAAHRQPE